MKWVIFITLRFLLLLITQQTVEDITYSQRICKTIGDKHKRAHWNPRKNGLQILEKFYFRRMRRLITQYTKRRMICEINKYGRPPTNQNTSQLLSRFIIINFTHAHIRYFRNSGLEIFKLCCQALEIWKLFKIQNRSSTHLKRTFPKVLHNFAIPRMIISHNERGSLKWS